MASFGPLRQCQINLLFSVTWKKSNAQCAKIIFFHEKKVDVRKRIFFLFYQIVMKCFFMQEFKCRIFMNPNFADFVMKTLYLAFKFVLNEKQSSWLTLLLVHSDTFYSFLLF